MTRDLIQVKNVYKTFGKKEVLKGINLSIPKGERIAILGANGAGKSTLVEMIALTSKPSSGVVDIDIKNNIKQEIGIQFQQGEWPTGITAKDMLDFYKKIYPKFNNEREKQLESVFELSEFYKRPLRRLSGGQKQRFNAMLSVLNNPEIIILDELTTGLDMELQFKILNYFKETTEAEKQTLILVSHNPEEVEKLCNRMVIIHDGKVFYDEKVKDVVKKHGSVRKLMEIYFKGGLMNEN